MAPKKKIPKRTRKTVVRNNQMLVPLKRAKRKKIPTGTVENKTAPTTIRKLFRRGAKGKTSTKESRREILKPLPTLPKDLVEASDLVAAKAQEIIHNPNYLRFVPWKHFDDVESMSNPHSNTLYVESGNARRVVEKIRKNHSKWYFEEHHHPKYMPTDGVVAFNILFKDNLSSLPVTLDDFKKHFKPKGFFKKKIVYVDDYKKPFSIFEDGKLTEPAKERLRKVINSRLSQVSKGNEKNQAVLRHISPLFLDEALTSNAVTALEKAYAYYMKNSRRMHMEENRQIAAARKKQR